MDKDTSVSNKDNTDQTTTLEQYKILVESLNKFHETRETSNNFWMGVNGVGISALAYLRDARNITQHHKSILLISLIMIGVLFCVSWLRYLRTIKNSIEIRSRLLAELEDNFPNALFSKIFTHSQDESRGTSALTLNEMLVPCLFLIGYVFFAVLLFFFPEETTAPFDKNHVSSNIIFQRDHANS